MTNLSPVERVLNSVNIAWKKFKRYLHKNPAVAYGWVVLIAGAIVKRYPEIPTELVILTLLSLFGLSKTVQNVENKKTEEALYTKPPRKKAAVDNSEGE